MPFVTEIKLQKKKKSVNVYLDGKYGFSLDLENFLKTNLKADVELSELEIANLKTSASFSITKEKLLNFATIRPRSDKEIDLWFRRKKVPNEFHSDLKKRLIELELIDDYKFATWWIDQRNLFRPKSEKVLYLELKVKGVSNDIIKKALSLNKPDEKKIALGYLEKRSYKWAKLDRKVKEQKMGQYLFSKGFDWDVIRSAIDGFEENT